MSKKSAQFWLIVGLAVACGTHPLRAASHSGSSDSYTRLIREAALVLLKEGNMRYVANEPRRPNFDAARRTNTVAQGQEPFVTVVACSDSRVPVEAILDRGVGDVFVIRVAGNIAGESELASIEYGVGHLNTPVLVVMGHSHCGAVTAVVRGDELHGHLQVLAKKIKPAALSVEETPNPAETIARAVEANVWQTISDVLTKSSTVREKVAGGQTQVMGAVYDLESGKVKWLGSHPDEKHLLAATADVAEPGHHAETTTSQAHPEALPIQSVPKHRAQKPRLRPGVLTPLASPYMNPLEPAGHPKSTPSGHGTKPVHGSSHNHKNVPFTSPGTPH